MRLENSQDLGILQNAQVNKVQLASEGLIYDDKVGFASVLLVCLYAAYDNICMPDGRTQVAAILLQDLLFCPS